MADLTFTGDMLFSARMNEIANDDYSEIFAKATKLKNCDYLVGNLETPVAGEALKYTYERYRFNTPSSALKAIKDCGFDMLTLANNHCMDRGEEGIINTLKNCEDIGFETVGVYATERDREKVFIKEFDGIKVAFVNYTYGTNAFAHHTFLENPYMVNLLQPEETLEGSIHLLNDYKTIEQDVNRIYFQKTEEYLKAKPFLEQLERDIKYAKENSDYVIMLLHCGGQYVQPVDPYSEFIAQRIKEYGADIIIGHHQHIIQKSEHKDGYLKIFCLGNLICDNRIVSDDCYFDMPLFSAVFHLTLTKDENGKINAKKSFSIYTTAFLENGLPIILDSADMLAIKKETYLKMQILDYANLFAGEDKYTEVKERYEL